VPRLQREVLPGRPRAQERLLREQPTLPGPLTPARTWHRRRRARPWARRDSV